MKRIHTLSQSIPLRRHPLRPRLFFWPGWWAVCLFACGWIGQPHNQGHASTKQSVESSRSILGNINKAREYKGRYQEAREVYETALTAYHESWRELNEIQEEILLHNANEDDFRELLRRERQAWGRLYRESGDEESRMAETERQAPGMESLPPKFRLEKVEESREGVISRTIHRYRYWKTRYDFVRSAQDDLERQRALLDPVLREQRQELRRARERSGDSRSLLQRELDAWSRLYRK